MDTGESVGARLWRFAVWALVIFFVLNLIAMIASVLVNSFATRWFGTWLPLGATTDHYAQAWEEFSLPEVLWVTFQVVGAVVVICGVAGVPAAYALARREFPGKRAVTALFLLPLLVPPMTYGIPLTRALDQMGVGGTLWAVILANLVPSLPFAILVMVPFIEQIDPRVEQAARTLGGSTFTLFRRILVPLLAPGILAALLLVLVRTIAMFELTFLTAPTGQETLVVALYDAVYAPGVRPPQSIDAMAVVYMITTLVWLVLALCFVNPTQIVARAKKGAH
jgi:putative spermidine/putrescine transport system permease protein